MSFDKYNKHCYQNIKSFHHSKSFLCPFAVNPLISPAPSSPALLSVSIG